MVPSEPRLVAGSVALAAGLWDGSLAVTGRRLVQAGVLIGVGVLVPTASNGYRRR